MTLRWLLFSCVLIATTTAFGGGPEPIVQCESERGIRPVCGLQNPEDLAVLPDGTLLLSQMGLMDGTRPGGLAHFDPDTERSSSLFPRGGIGALPDVAAIGPTPGWGEANCPGPPSASFSPHGIDLARRPDGRLQLLVVNHGGRESVEIFEVETSAAGTKLAWRGCAIPPEPHFMNDVSALPDGGFVVTHMFPKSGTIASLYHGVRGLLGGDTGYVLEWSAEEGFREIPGTAGAMPNGVATSPDGRYVFVNVYLGNEVRRVARDGSEPSASAEVAHPDNVTWSPDGRLLVASHVAPFSEMMACSNLEAGACPLAFEIVAIDPVSMRSEVVFRNSGAPMGAGTAAVVRGGELFIGSFAGDRIIRVALP